MVRKSLFGSLIVALAAALMLGVPAMAQEDPTNPNPAPVVPGTITVTGMGEASGAPDVANLTLGVQIVDADIKAAFAGANAQIEQVIDAIVAVGVAESDIRTSGLNIYQEQQPMGPESGATTASRYYVSNQVLVTVRDITKVADVINAAVEAGANNLYGLDFSIDDHAALETTAREDAFADAQERATALATLAGVTLGEVQSITEMNNGGFFPPTADRAMGGGGAAIQPGQLQVNVQLQVTFGINR
jgi:uncharacterized protein YggE